MGRSAGRIQQAARAKRIAYSDRALVGPVETQQLTAQISKTAGPMISKKDCARVVDAFLDAIKESLQTQKNIEVRGFGTFKIRHRKTRMARNPRTGSPVEVSARPVPVFKPSKELRAMVAGIDIEHLEDDEEELSPA